MFMLIDDNGNGTVSFQEWVKYLVQVRFDVLQEEREEEVEKKQVASALIEIAEAAFDDADDDWSGEFEFAEFVRAFRGNVQFIEKIALACDVPLEALTSLSDEEIEELFHQFDVDHSGSISFEEFIKGLAEIRLVSARAQAHEQAEQAEEGHVPTKIEEQLEEAFVDAAEAFENAAFSIDGELSFDDFVAALQDPVILRKIQSATQLPFSFLRCMDMDTMKALFTEIDVDGSGSIDFQEWVNAFFKVRENYLTEEMEHEYNALRASQLAESAFDEIDGDIAEGLDLQTFLIAFRRNPRFVQNVANAMEVDEDCLHQLKDRDLEDLFKMLDTDFNGKVSFHEFVQGLVDLRLGHELAETEAKGESKRKPYVLTEAVSALPALGGEAKAKVATAFAKYDAKGMGFDAKAGTVASLLRDLDLVVDDKAASKYMETAFAGNDLSCGFLLTDCEVLYQVALDAQPLWSKALSKSASMGSLSATDMRAQETRLRKLFGKHADSSGAINLERVGPLLKDIGFMDTAAYTPRYLDTFMLNHRAGPVQFPEVVGLCNAAMHHMLMSTPSPATAALSLSLSDSAEQLARKGCRLPPIQMGRLGAGISGSPAIALRRKRTGEPRINMAAPGKVLPRSQMKLGGSASTGRLYVV